MVAQFNLQFDRWCLPFVMHLGCFFRRDLIHPDSLISGGLIEEEGKHEAKLGCYGLMGFS